MNIRRQTPQLAKIPQRNSLKKMQILLISKGAEAKFFRMPLRLPAQLGYGEATDQALG